MDSLHHHCPSCQREILPNRIKVAIQPPSPVQIAPTAKVEAPPPVRRSKTGTVRTRNGQTTTAAGRAKSTTHLKRSDSIAPAPAAPTPAPIKYKTVIDKVTPIPLYCSDTCRLEDMQSSYLGYDVDPNRTSSSLARHVVADYDGETESDSSLSASSHESTSPRGVSVPLACAEPAPAAMSPSMRVLAEVYQFGPMPPPAPGYNYETDSWDDVAPPPLSFPTSSRTHPASFPDHGYTSGNMMAGKRIKETFMPARPKRSTGRYAHDPTREMPQIPGWTDGSNAWRASVYSLSAPLRNMRDADEREQGKRAYRSFVASSHRSTGVFSTVSCSAPGEALVAPPPARKSRSSSMDNSLATEEMVNSYNDIFARKSAARQSSSYQGPSTLSTMMARERSSSPSTIAVPRRDHSLARSHTETTLTSPPSPTSFERPSIHRRPRSLVKRGAEGMLLVPDVMSSSLPRSDSSSSLNHQSNRSRRSSAGSASSIAPSTSLAVPAMSPRRNTFGPTVSSPLSRYGSDEAISECLPTSIAARVADSEIAAESDEDVATSLPNLRASGIARRASQGLERPKLETRSWSYDNVRTYDVPLPMQKVIVDGVEVEEPQPLKRLFLFAPKPTGRRLQC